MELFELVINESCGDFVQRQFEDGTLASLESALESGEVIYNGEKMARCVADLDTAECDVDITTLFTGCDTAFDGQIAEGGSCAYNQVCQDNLVCILGSECPGTCKPESRCGRLVLAQYRCAGEPGGHQETCVSPVGRGSNCTENGIPATRVFSQSQFIRWCIL